MASGYSVGTRSLSLAPNHTDDFTPSNLPARRRLSLTPAEAETSNIGMAGCGSFCPPGGFRGGRAPWGKAARSQRPEARNPVARRLLLIGVARAFNRAVFQVCCHMIVITATCWCSADQCWRDDVADILPPPRNGSVCIVLVLHRACVSLKLHSATARPGTLAQGDMVLRLPFEPRT